MLLEAALLWNQESHDVRTSLTLGSGICFSNLEKFERKILIVSHFETNRDTVLKQSCAFLSLESNSLLIKIDHQRLYAKLYIVLDALFVVLRFVSSFGKMYLKLASLSDID